MIYVILAVLGLCFGSFVNALVWRLHEQSKPKKKRVTSSRELSIIKGRSICPHCTHPLAVHDLVPVLSWLRLGGKCRYCKKSIGLQYPFVEILTASLFVLSYQLWSIDLNTRFIYFVHFAAWLAAIVIGVALAVYDLKWMILPNKLVSILSAVGVIFAVPFVFSSTGSTSILDVLLSVGIAGGIFYILFQVSDGKWIGGGDVKLGLVLGLFLLSAENALLMLFVASSLGCTYAFILVLLGKYKKGVRIPFGPALLLATYLVVLFGDKVLNYYQTMILL